MSEYRDIIEKKFNNYLRAEKHKEAGDVVLTSYPVWLTVDPASYCNLKCPFCPTGQQRGTRPARLMDLDYFKRVLDEIGIYLVNIDFCNWGEPQLNPNLYDMIAYAKKFHVFTKVDTNFNIFDEKKASQLIESGLDKIILSIDGASQESYSKYRIGGDFDKVIDNIRLLVSKRAELKSKTPEIEWQFLVFKHNQHEIEKARTMSKELGVDMIGITAPYIGDPSWLPDIEPYRSKYYELEKSSDDKLEFKASEQLLCNWLWDAITLNTNGSVSACCSVEEAKDDFFQDFFEKPFLELWNSKQYIQAREHVLKSDRSISETSDNICVRCDHIGQSNHRDIECIIRTKERESRSE